MASSLTPFSGTLLRLGLLLALIHAVKATESCGTGPQMIYVAKGERRTVQFWNTDGINEGSGLEPDSVNELESESILEPVPETSVSTEEEESTDALQSAVALISTAFGDKAKGSTAVAGVVEVADLQTNAEEVEPFVVMPTGPEEAIEEEIPEIEAREPVIVQAETNDKVVNLLLQGRPTDSNDKVTTEAEAAEHMIVETNKAEEPKIDSTLQEKMDTDKEASGQTIETATEMEYMTTLDPYDLVAIADVDGSVVTQEHSEDNKQRIVPLEGSGDEENVSLSATVAVHKYEEIKIPFDPAEHADITTLQEDTVILPLPSHVQREGLIASVIDAVSDIVSDEAVDMLDDAEGSGSSGASNLDLIISTYQERTNEKVDKLKEQSSTDVKDSHLHKTPEVKLNSVESENKKSAATAPKQTQSPEALSESVSALADEADTETDDSDELLPLVQPTIHDLLLSLPLRRYPAEPEDDYTSNEVANELEESSGDVIMSIESKFVHTEQDLGIVPQKEYDEEIGEQLDRLLLVQGLTSGDRVILEHVPDSDLEGSGEVSDNTDIDAALFQLPEGDDQSEDVESSGDLDQDHPVIPEPSTHWVDEEKRVVGATGSRAEVPNSAMIDLVHTEAPSVKDNELPNASVEWNVSVEHLPLAETEGFPSSTANNTDMDADTGKQLTTASDNYSDTTQKVQVTSDASVVNAKTSGGLAAETGRSHQSLSRDAVLNIYRLLDHPKSRFTAETRPSWKGFRGVRRRTDRSLQYRAPYHQEGHPSRTVLPSRPEQQHGEFDAIRSLRYPDDNLFRFFRSQPAPLMSALLNGWPRLRTSRLSAAVDCEWVIKTEPHLYLLVTLENLGAPYTVNCDGAYIEVERERDGFEARWCGNRIKQSGARPHTVFARGEVRIAVFNDGNTTGLPTGFSADVEVVDLAETRQYTMLRRSDLLIPALARR